jgi:hypothetical protein
MAINSTATGFIDPGISLPYWYPASPECSKRYLLHPAHPKRYFTRPPRAAQGRRFARRTRPFPDKAAGEKKPEA